MSGVPASDLFPSILPASAYSLWDAKLFPVCRFDDINSSNSGVRVVTSDGRSIPLKTTNILTWFHSLTANGGSSEDITEWRRSKRYSLSDLLSHGDANQMLQWRLFCTAVHECDAHYYHKSLAKQTLSDADSRLVELSTAYEAVAQFCRLSSELPGGDGRACLLLWCFSLSCENTQEQLSVALTLLLGTKDSDLVGDRSINAFLGIKSAVSKLVNQSAASLVIAHYLKKRVISDRDILDVCDVLLSREVLCLLPVEVQPRVCFIAAWLLKNRRIEKISEGLVKHMECTGASSTLDLKTSGVEFICAMWANIKLAIAESGTTVGNAVKVSKLVEAYGQRVISSHVQFSLRAWQARQPSESLSRSAPSSSLKSVGVACISEAPVRVDLAGGWSDTPPICYELGGKVNNIVSLFVNYLVFL